MEDQTRDPLYDYDMAPFHKSGLGAQLFDGCDRKLYALSFVLCADAVLMWRTWWAAGLFFALFLFIRYWLKVMGKADPLMARVAIRSLFYRDRYEARCRYHAKLAYVPRKWEYA